MRRNRSLLVATLLSLPTVAIADPPRALHDSQVVARVPAPGYPGPMGYPEGLAVNGSRVYVGASATFGTAGSVPSRVYAFDRKTGTLEREYEIRGQNLAFEHAISALAFDGLDRLYVLDTQQGVLRLSLDGQTQEVYATIPDLPACAPGVPAPCSPTLFDRPPLPNDLAFAPDGTLYVTDSFQATVWRIPPGGAAQPWFQDARLDALFGPNGVRIGPDGNTLYLVRTTTGFDFGQPGYVYTLPLVNAPGALDLQTFATFPFENPDGIAFGASGKLYVVLAISNEIAVLRPDGSEEWRLRGPAMSAQGPVPWDAPASVAFDNASGALLVTNHALLSGLAEHFVVFDVYVADRELPLNRPLIP